MNSKSIKEIINVFEDSKLSKMELEIDDMKIKMEKGNHQPQVVEEIPAFQNPMHTEKKVEEAQPHGTWVKAPLVGTFYHSSGSGSAPFVTIGQSVKKGDILCIIEAMKVMNELHSPMDGIVQEILVTNDSMVEYDQDLIRIGETQ